MHPPTITHTPPPTGNHEATDINALFGFRTECQERLGMDKGQLAWQRVNALFNWLPLAACIEDKILCMHGGMWGGCEKGCVGWARMWVYFCTIITITIPTTIVTGIGRSINTIDQIRALTRPLTMADGDTVLMDLLWSDPTTNDAVEGVQPSPRGPGLVTFGPDRVKEFCKVCGVCVVGCGGGMCVCTDVW